MAKQLNGARTAQLHHDGTAWQLRFTSYGPPSDSIDDSIEYKRMGSDESQRDLTVGELSGTLQSFLDARDAAYKITEGID